MQMNHLRQLYDDLISSIGEGMQLDPDQPVNEQTENLPYDRRYEIPIEQISIGRLLGEGQFGKVYEGTVTDNEGRITTAAVKTPKSNSLGMFGLKVQYRESFSTFFSWHESRSAKSAFVGVQDHDLYRKSRQRPETSWRSYETYSRRSAVCRDGILSPRFSERLPKTESRSLR